MNPSKTSKTRLGASLPRSRARSWHVGLCLLLTALTLKLMAQDPSRPDPEFTATTIEGPKGIAFAVGDGTVWFLEQNHLGKLDPANNHVVSVPLEVPAAGPYDDGDERHGAPVLRGWRRIYLEAGKEEQA